MEVHLEPIPLPKAALIGAAVGVGAHLGYFIRGDHTLRGPQYLSMSILVPLVIFGILARLYDDLPYPVPAKITAVTVSSFFGALFTSMLIYRAFFHPLRNFPGPFSYKLTKLAQTVSISKKLRNFEEAEELRKQYGSIVRVGPNELTIFKPEAMTAVSGVGSKCMKAPWYDGVGYPFHTMHTVRDRGMHDKRRKTWDQGFSAKALRSYEPRVMRYSDLLMDQMKAHAGKPVDASSWLNFYSFDVMGDLAFGHSFDMLETGKRHRALQLLADGMEPLGLFTPIPWILPILMNVPGLGAGLKEFIIFGDGEVEKRRKYEPDEPDVMTWLIDAEKNKTDPVIGDKRWMTGDARLIIVAGSDTTAASLTFTIFHLAKNPDCVEKLRKELKELNYLSGSETELRHIQDAPYLNGVINEALRLHPPVPSGLLRVTPPEGLNIDGTVIPGGVTVSCPAWPMGHLESCYERPEEFIPERWGSKPELVRNKAAFAPFSVGVYGCVGKQLALMEMRSVIARTVTQFDLALAPGEDGHNLVNKSKDVFTIDLKPVMLVYTQRKAPSL